MCVWCVVWVVGLVVGVVGLVIWIVGLVVWVVWCVVLVVGLLVWIVGLLVWVVGRIVWVVGCVVCALRRVVWVVDAWSVLWSNGNYFQYKDKHTRTNTCIAYPSLLFIVMALTKTKHTSVPNITQHINRIRQNIDKISQENEHFSNPRKLHYNVKENKKTFQI